MLKAYADEKRLSAEERFALAYFYSLCYCIPSAIIMFDQREQIQNDPEKWANLYKQDIIFQSDRRYVRCGTTFRDMLRDYTQRIERKDFQDKCVHGETVDFDKAFGIVSGWHFFGRFSCFLFIETYARLMGYKVTEGSIRWKDGDTATSGLLNVFGYDNAAERFDKSGSLPERFTQQRLDEMYGKLLGVIKARGGAQTIAEVETSLCAYRKFYKGTRYNGYYLDRQLEELNHYAAAGRHKEMVNTLFRLRKKNFDSKYLGEIGGWEGVRKECKTLYKRTGRTM